MLKQKYIKTSDRQIVVFGEAMKHSDFSHLNPKSAGYISFSVNRDFNIICSCHGESTSLKLKAEEEDTRLAQLQIIGTW